MQKLIKDYCNLIGLDLVGFIKCREFNELEDFFRERKELNLENEFEEKDIEKRINPLLYMKEGKTIISIVFPYLYEKNDNNGFSLYTKTLDYHKVVKSYLEKICTYINSLGGEAVSFVDSNAMPERYIAALAGVGFIGKNNMIITKKYGSFVFLGEIITDLEIHNEDYTNINEIKKTKNCLDCTRCIKHCPTKAINETKKNSNICSSYITQKKELNNIEIKLLKNRVFGCDICQTSCIYNEDISYSNIKEFKPLDYMKQDTKVYADIDNKFFKEKIVRTSCGWRGKNIIKRNSIIRLFNEGKDISIFKSESPYLNSYIDRLLESKEK